MQAVRRRAIATLSVLERWGFAVRTRWGDLVVASTPETVAVRETTSRFLAALGTEDGKQICPLLSARGQAWLVAKAQENDDGVAGCHAAAELLYTGLGRVFSDAAIGTVRVRGPRARVSVMYRHAGVSKILLTRVNDRWLIDVG